MFVGFCWDVDGISHSIPSTAQEDHCVLDTVGPRRSRSCVWQLCDWRGYKKNLSTVTFTAVRESKKLHL